MSSGFRENSWDEPRDFGRMGSSASGRACTALWTERINPLRDPPVLPGRSPRM